MSEVMQLCFVDEAVDTCIVLQLGNLLTVVLCQQFFVTHIVIAFPYSQNYSVVQFGYLQSLMRMIILVKPNHIPHQNEAM